MSRRALVALAIGAAVAVGGCGGSDDSGPTARSQWSVFEDHDSLVREGKAKREQTLTELRALGVDTLRVMIKWNEVAPRRGEYTGWNDYDDLLRRAQDEGFRVIADLAPDTPRWATAAQAPVTADNVNTRPDPRAFADFAEAVARRYRDEVDTFSIWNEPNHVLFLKPQREAPRIYRELVAAALPRIRQHAPDSEVLVGETAPSGSPVRRSARPSSCGAGCASTRTSTARSWTAAARRSRGSTSTGSRTTPTAPRSGSRPRRTSSACWSFAGSGATSTARPARAGCPSTCPSTTPSSACRATRRTPRSARRLRARPR